MGWTGPTKKPRRNRDAISSRGSWPRRCWVRPSGSMNTKDSAMHHNVTDLYSFVLSTYLPRIIPPRTIAISKPHPAQAMARRSVTPPRSITCELGEGIFGRE